MMGMHEEAGAEDVVSGASKVRFLAALTGNTLPDRIPVAPDISGLVPARMTGRPFWDTFLRGITERWENYIKAADHFGFDGWIGSCLGVPLTYPANPRVTSERSERYSEDQDAIDVTHVIHTPDGDLRAITRFYRDDASAPVERLVKDLAVDFKKFRHTFVLPDGVDSGRIETARRECEKRGWAFGMALECPGLQSWNGAAGLEQLSYTLVDHPEILEEWREFDNERAAQQTRLALSLNPDYLLLHASGALALASPALFREFALPGIAAMSRLAREAGVPTMLHSCGKSRALVDILAEETDVDLLNPVEKAPMGDVDLAEAKAARGRRLSLMGNLHTTDVMLNGTREQVRREALLAMAAGGPGGRFILSTGDQCGRDTPEANIHAMVETAKELGAYAPDGTLPLVEKELKHLASPKHTQA